MGCARSKFHSSALDESEDRPDATKTCCCWTGIKKCFSKSKKSKSIASSEVMEDDVDSDDDSDDVSLANDINEASVASSQSVIDSEPRVLHKSRSVLALGTSSRKLHALAATVKSAPAVLGQDCHEVLMPSLREVEDKPLSPSHPKDTDVSSQAVQLYQHRANHVNQESKGEIDDGIEEIIETRSQRTQAVVVRRCNLVFRANIVITYQSDEVSSRHLSIQPGNAITRRRRGNARAQIRVAVSVDEIAAMYFISQLWTFIRNPFLGAYQAGLQTIHDALVGTPNDTEVDEGSAVILHEGAGDHPPEERQPDLSSWTFICNVCFIAYHVGRQIVHDLFIGEDVNEEETEEGSGDGGKEEGIEEEDGSGEGGDEEEEKEEEGMEEEK